jgi:hypothetical protein
LALVGIGQLVILGVQAAIFSEQRKLMDGQLKTTVTTANAALAGLDRPWLVVEGLRHNQQDWLDCNNPLIAEFQIANYGKAPAFVKRITVRHFRGPDHHNGYPSPILPEGVFHFPEKEMVASFIGYHGKPALQELKSSSNNTTIQPEAPQVRAFSPVPSDYSFVVSGGDHSEVFCALGHTKLTAFVTGIPIIETTESYLLGFIYYEFPGNQSELMRFCYKANSRGGFDLYRDYAPYNETKNAKPN